MATAGIIVAAGTASLLVGGIDFFRSFGPALAVTALVGMVVALTLMPALLSVAGGRVARGRSAAARAGRPPASLRLLGRRPVALAAAVLTAGLLLAGASGLRETTLGTGLTSGLPVDAGARAAADAIDAGFPPGVRGPTELLLEGPGAGADPAALDRLASALRGPAGRRRGGRGGRPGAGHAARGRLHHPGRRRGAHAGRAARRSHRAPGHRDDPPPPGRLPGMLAAAGLGGVSASLAGDSALATATVDATSGELLRVGIVAALVNLLLLALFLRALVAPLYLLAAGILSVAASLGLATYLFQDVLGQGQIVYYVPFATAVLLLALGSDYNIFLVGQIRDEAGSAGVRDALMRVGARSGPAIAVAGVVLAASFALLAIVPLDAMRQFAFVMGAGVLIDAFLVRSVLVPSLIVLTGDAGRRPGRPGQGSA